MRWGWKSSRSEPATGGTWTPYRIGNENKHSQKTGGTVVALTPLVGFIGQLRRNTQRRVVCVSRTGAHRDCPTTSSVLSNRLNTRCNCVSDHVPPRGALMCISLSVPTIALCECPTACSEQKSSRGRSGCAKHTTDLSRRQRNQSTAYRSGRARPRFTSTPLVCPTRLFACGQNQIAVALDRPRTAENSRPTANRQRLCQFSARRRYRHPARDAGPAKCFRWAIRSRVQRARSS